MGRSMSGMSDVKTQDRAEDAQDRPDATGPLHVFIAPAPEAPRVWGLTPAERLRRAFAGAEVAEVREAGGRWPDQGSVILLRGDVVYDQAILQGLQTRSGVGLVLPGDGGGRPVAAHVRVADAADTYAWLTRQADAPEDAEILDAREVASAYRRSLRKTEPPYCIVLDRDGVRAAERRIYMGAYKGVTDLITKYVWPVPAMWATRGCVALGLSPNAVTTVGAALMLLALWLFWTGDYGWGLLAAWIMTFLDTVDGKLARVTLTASPFGNVFDHGIDLIHPPFWYLAWGFGLSAFGTPLPPGWLAPTLVVIFAGYVIVRLMEGYFIRRFGFHLHVWRRFDSFFRLIVARRNPNLILLSAGWLLGRPDLGLLAVAGWTVVAIVVHAVQLAQAEWRRARGAQPVSWLQATT